MVSIKELRCAIKSAQAVTGDDRKFALQTILFEFPTPTEMTITASNGHCLIHFSFNLDHPINPGTSFCADGKKCLGAMKDLPKDKAAQAAIVIFGDVLMIMSGELCFSLEKMGTAKDFADYKAVINGDYQCTEEGKIIIDASLFIKMFTPLLPLMGQFNTLNMNMNIKGAPLFFEPQLKSDWQSLSKVTAIIMPMNPNA